MADPQKPGTITGYRPQTEEHIDLVNRIKGMENQLGDLYAELAARDDIDPRMFELARTNHQQGFMWLVRSIFQPHSRL